MNPDVYPFTVGDFRCLAVSDGTMSYAPPNFPPPAIFLCANAPQDQLTNPQNVHAAEIIKWTEWKSTYNCLVIDTGKLKVLVDTGADGLAPTTGKLISHLQASGIAPSDINMVIITHGHPDHLGGNIDALDQPSFPVAHWVISKAEWEFWTTNQAEQKLAAHGKEMLIGIARKSLLPLKDKINLLDADNEVVPGIQVISAPGHTPGQVAVKISSHGEQLLCISDMVLHPVHLVQPEWCAATDVAPQDLVTTRHQVLPQAVAQKALVMAFHFPFPGLGHIEAKGGAWDWKPI